jgi:carbamate kinase
MVRRSVRRSERDFAAGSMGPKVEAACRFAGRAGRRAAIGRLDDLAELIDGTAGTQVEREKPAIDD